MPAEITSGPMPSAGIAAIEYSRICVFSPLSIFSDGLAGQPSSRPARNQNVAVAIFDVYGFGEPHRNDADQTPALSALRPSM